MFVKLLGFLTIVKFEFSSVKQKLFIELLVENHTFLFEIRSEHPLKDFSLLFSDFSQLHTFCYLSRQIGTH